MSKQFSWSWSRLKNYRTCPKKHYHVDLAKDYVEPEGDALQWGHSVHEAMANRITKGTPLPNTMQHYDWWPATVGSLRTDLGLQVKCEQKLAMDEQFQPVSFFDGKAWFRGVIDVLVLLHMDHKAALTLDWKTGKVDPSFEQLGLSAQLIFSHYPEIDSVGAIYVWLGHDDEPTVKTYHRDQMTPIWTEIMPEVRVLKHSFDKTEYPPKPSGICIKHCPVSSCPYFRKGSR